MPKKPNSYGKEQEYIPAGNGDASGEYADENGSNKGFKNFHNDNKGVDKPKSQSDTPKLFPKSINAEKSAVNKYMKQQVLSETTPIAFNLDNGQYICNGASVLRLETPAEIDVETPTQENTGFIRLITKSLEDASEKVGDTIKIPSLKEIREQFKANPESKTFYKLDEDYHVDGKMLKNILDVLGDDIQEAHLETKNPYVNRRATPLYIKTGKGEAFVLPKRKIE